MDAICIQGAGVTSKHQSSIKYQNTGPYALPSQTFDSNTNQKDQGVSVYAYKNMHCALLFNDYIQ